MKESEKGQKVREGVRESISKALPMFLKALSDGICELDESSQAKVLNALYDGIDKLDESSRTIVLSKVGAVCSQAVRAGRERSGIEYPTGVDLETACEFYWRAALSNELLKRDFSCKSEGNTVEIRDPITDVVDGCGCVLVLAGLIEPRESLCTSCQPGFWEDNFQHMTGRRPEEYEFPESHTMGGRYCVARCHFRPAK